MESLTNTTTVKPVPRAQTKKVEESKVQEVKKIDNSKVELKPVNEVKKQVKKVEEVKQSELAEGKEVVYNNGECMVCMSVMVEPVMLPCKHVFCAQCATIFLEKCSQCPLDRKIVPKNFKLVVDKDLQTKIRNYIPKEFSARELEIRKGQGLLADLVELEFEVGNTYKKLTNFRKTGANGEYEHKHQWSLYVKPLNDDVRIKQHMFIKNVKLYLHPTFREPTRWIRPVIGEKLELADVISWGHFPIEVTIFWTQRTGQQVPLSCTHQLVFDPKGSKKTYKVKFDKNKIDPIIGTKKEPAPPAKAKK
jgi:hypothetical protein